MRAKPRLWLSLPTGVVDPASRGAIEPSRDVLLEVAGWLERCAPGDRGCLEAVRDRCDARAASEPADNTPGTARSYWESVAHAVDRLCDAVPAGAPDAGSAGR